MSKVRDLPQTTTLADDDLLYAVDASEGPNGGRKITKSDLKTSVAPTAAETKADGEKRAEIKRAEGIKAAKVLEAEGEAQAIQLVNEAAEKFFVGNAQVLRRIEALEKSLSANTKIVLPSDKDIVNVIGDMAGVLPLTRRRDSE